jgi:hypothetical protein
METAPALPDAVYTIESVNDPDVIGSNVYELCPGTVMKTAILPTSSLCPETRTLDFVRSNTSFLNYADTSPPMA